MAAGCYSQRDILEGRIFPVKIETNISFSINNPTMQTCTEPRKDKHSPPPKTWEQVELTLGVPFDEYKKNPVTVSPLSPHKPLLTEEKGI